MWAWLYYTVYNVIGNQSHVKEAITYENASITSINFY